MERGRLLLAIWLGKLIGFFSRITNMGGGTAIAGVVGLFIDPLLIEKLSSQLPQRAVLITGTNGKTTTARMLANICEKGGIPIIHNRSGSNLLRGIASCLINKASMGGKIEAKLAIWEVDEANLDMAVTKCNPVIVVITNLFRDQLDRYGEVDSIRKSWEHALKKRATDLAVALNADDPGVAILAQDLKHQVLFFGVNDSYQKQQSSQAADSSFCLRCHQRLTFSTTFSAHLGWYFCHNCHFSRPQPDIAAVQIQSEGLTTIITTHTPKGVVTYQQNLPGLYNVYNSLAAISAATLLNIEQSAIQASFLQPLSVFGRVEKISYSGKQGIIFLIKNPAGANEVIKTIINLKPSHFLIALNDNLADGKDVSWIWDVNFELLEPFAQHIVAGGGRCLDLANRLKYASINLNKLIIQKNMGDAISQAFVNMDNNSTLFILPTYTALLELRHHLVQLGEVQPFWKH